MGLSYPPGAGGPRRFYAAAALFRLGLAAAVLGLFVYAYLTPHLRLLAMAVKSQFSPILYGSGIAGLTVLCGLALALLCGRVYCSVLCPLGTLQELAFRAGKALRRRAKRAYADPPKLRHAVLFITGLGIIFSFSLPMIILDPVSQFGRGLGALRALLNGSLAPFALVLALPLALILGAAFFQGRVFCDWCPVGLCLGLLSSVSPLGMKVSSRCVSCGICEKHCPAGCFNSRKKTIDTDRCVLCLSCATVCPQGAAGYGLRLGPAMAAGGVSRRFFLKNAAPFFCGAVYLLGANLKLFSFKAPELSLPLPGRGFPILPPGAGDQHYYRAHCISCQACAAACPVKIIKIKESPNPVLDYGDGFCQYNCVECGKVCPTGAIRPLSVEDKQRTRIALSKLLFDYCVVNTKRESCGACAEVCPTRALTMRAHDIPGLTRPVFDEQYCIGCGACLSVCPAEPRAFLVEGMPRQSLTSGIRPSEAGGEGDIFRPTDDFPF